MTLSTFSRLTLVASLAVLVSCRPSILDAHSTQPLKRQDVPPPNPNGPIAGWSYVGCFTDIASSRTLVGDVILEHNLTPATCTEFCQGTAVEPKGFNFAGLEFTSECYCDFNIQGTATQVEDAECNFPCAGDETLDCGGSGRVSVFTNGGLPPTNRATVGSWTFAGCHTDAIDGNGRTLLERFDIPTGVTVESCTTQCAATGFNITGLEFGQECWCGSSFLFPNTTAPLGDCSMACKADHTEFCGASSRLSVYVDSPEMINTESVEPPPAVTSN
ncbi:unnamed protein product [Cyclocybe aegerita]|uniref:WSC domain-containing protein n=1 Tax=Cyclocybe aegerita TaxID=1973307 RepID=A0A8S0XQZ9_CYCAE|nr:unnamed protein product [Cyclocybe aegerita]